MKHEVVCGLEDLFVNTLCVQPTKYWNIKPSSKGVLITDKHISQSLWKDASVFVDGGLSEKLGEQKIAAFDVDFWWSNGAHSTYTHDNKDAFFALVSSNWLRSYQQSSLGWWGVQMFDNYRSEPLSALFKGSGCLSFSLGVRRTFVYVRILCRAFN